MLACMGGASSHRQRLKRIHYNCCCVTFYLGENYEAIKFVVYRIGFKF